MLRAQGRDAGQVDFQPVPRCDFGQDCRIGCACCKQGDELLEVLLESGRRDNLQNARVAIGGVPRLSFLLPVPAPASRQRGDDAELLPIPGRQEPVASS